MDAPRKYGEYDTDHLHGLFLAVIEKRDDAESTIQACDTVITEILDEHNRRKTET